MKIKYVSPKSRLTIKSSHWISCAPVMISLCISKWRSYLLDRSPTRFRKKFSTGFRLFIWLKATWKLNLKLWSSGNGLDKSLCSLSLWIFWFRRSIGKSHKLKDWSSGVVNLKAIISRDPLRTCLKTPSAEKHHSSILRSPQNCTTSFKSIFSIKVSSTYIVAFSRELVLGLFRRTVSFALKQGNKEKVFPT